MFLVPAMTAGDYTLEASARAVRATIRGSTDVRTSTLEATLTVA